MEIFVVWFIRDPSNMMSMFAGLAARHLAAKLRLRGKIVFLASPAFLSECRFLKLGSQRF